MKCIGTKFYVVSIVLCALILCVLYTEIKSFFTVLERTDETSGIASTSADDSNDHRFIRVQSKVKEAYSLPYPNHLYNVRFAFHVILSAFNLKTDISWAIDSLLRQDYPNIKIWIYGQQYMDDVSLLIESRYSAEPCISFLDCSKCDDENVHLWALRTVRESATPNDIMLVMDAEHQLILDNSISEINMVFVDTKCWVAHGAYILALNDQQNHIKYASLDNEELVTVSDSVWIFKAFLIDHLTKDDFFSEDMQPSSRATRMRYILHFLEISSGSRVQFISSALFSYGVTGDQKRLIDQAVTRNIEELKNSQHFEPFEEDIHVFLCIWGRKHLLSKILQSLTQKQTVSHRIHLHVWNNNPELTDYANQLAKSVARNIDIFHSDINLYSFARFLHIRKAMSEYHMDYAIIVDDDQNFPSDYVEMLYADRLPNVYRSWWGRQFRGLSYFEGVPHGSVLISGGDTDILDFDYAGPGGCVIDSGAFMMQAVYMIPKKFICLDDLWLSYVIYFAGWKAKRTFVRPTFIEDRKTNRVALWQTLKVEKDIFLDFLRAGGWDV